MVSTVEDVTMRRQMTPSKSLKRSSLPPSVAVSEALPDEISVDCLKTALPLPGLENGSHVNVKKDFVLGKNMHGSSLEITEPEHDDDVTGEKEAYMAGVLARYRKSLTEKTKFHLGGRLFSLAHKKTFILLLYH